MHYAVKDTGYGTQIKYVSEDASHNDIKFFTTKDLKELEDYLIQRDGIDLNRCEDAIACMLNADGEWIDV